MLKTNRKRVKRGFLLSNLESLKQGEYFFTDLKSNVITSYSNQYGIRVKTEKVLCLNPKTLKVDRLIKVTLL